METFCDWLGLRPIGSQVGTMSHVQDFGSDGLFKCIHIHRTHVGHWISRGGVFFFVLYSSSCLL